MNLTLPKMREATKEEAISKLRYETFYKNIESIKQSFRSMINDLTVPEIRPYLFIAGGLIDTAIINGIRHRGVNLNYGNTPICKSDVDFWLKTKPPRDVIKKQYKFIRSRMENSDFFVKDYPENQNYKRKALSLIYEGIFTDYAQFIIKYIGQPEEVVGTFDFVHCQGYYDIETDKLCLTDLQLQCILQRELIPTKNYKQYCDILVYEGIENQWKVLPTAIALTLSPEQVVKAERFAKRYNKFWNRGLLNPKYRNITPRDTPF